MGTHPWRAMPLDQIRACARLTASWLRSSRHDNFFSRVHEAYLGPNPRLLFLDDFQSGGILPQFSEDNVLETEETPFSPGKSTKPHVALRWHRQSLLSLRWLPHHGNAQIIQRTTVLCNYISQAIVTLMKAKAWSILRQISRKRGHDEITFEEPTPTSSE